MKKFRFQALALVALGSALGYFAANGGLGMLTSVQAHPAARHDTSAKTFLPPADGKPKSACCLDGGKQELLLADASVELAQASA